MIIRKTRINNLERYLPEKLSGKSFVVATLVSDKKESKIKKLGFDKLDLGETVLPKPMGPVSRFNANGKIIKHKDQPMVTAYRQAEWTWQEWRGRYDSVERSKIVDIPYKRYPRSFVAPPSVELSIAKDANGEKVICTTPVSYQMESSEELKHRINLFLEFFGECMVLDSNLDTITIPQVKRVNWTILPKGERPWDEVKKDVDPIVRRTKPMKQKIVYARLETIEKFKPDFVAIGRGGFQGYLVFGFSEEDLYVLESVYTGNATYVFDKNWEELSKLTKAEILNDSLQKDRLIHREGWYDQIKAILSNIKSHI